VSATTPYRSPVETGISLVAAALIAGLAGSMVGGTVQGLTGTSAPPAADAVVTATLVDTPAAEEFAAALPITVEAENWFGQAVIGRLPEGLPVENADRLVDPAAGHIYYWPPDGRIVVVTTDLGPSIPAPGLVDLGVVDSGLGDIPSAGNRFDMSITMTGA
jgi:hypothetical protein